MMPFQMSIKFLAILCLFGEKMQVIAVDPKHNIQYDATQEVTLRDPDTICADAGEIGNFPIDDDTCARYVVCYKVDKTLPDIKGHFMMCHAQWYFDPEQRSCTNIRPINCKTTEEPKTTIRTPPRDADTICADAGVIGIFPTEDDTTCTKYIVCYKPNKDQDIIKAIANNKCPTNPVQQYFDPVRATCRTVKPAECSTITTAEPTTTVSTPPRDADTICADAERIGNFPTEDDTCTQFIYCYKPNPNLQDIKGLLLNCASVSTQFYFDPVLGLCTDIKPDNCLTKEEPTTTVKSPPRDADTICADAGRVGSFPTEDDTCTQFIYCYKPNPNLQDIKGLLLNCASVSTQFYFDPVLGLCTDIKPDNCLTKEEPTTTVKSPPRDADTICADAGRVGSFPTEDDTTCTKFILCYKPNKDQDIFKALPLQKCPSSPGQQYFDPVLTSCTPIKPAECT